MRVVASPLRPGDALFGGLPGLPECFPDLSPVEVFWETGVVVAFGCEPPGLSPLG